MEQVGAYTKMKQGIGFLLLFVLILFNIGLVEAQSPETPKLFKVGVGLGCSFAGYRDEIEAPINRYLNSLTYIIDGNIEKGPLLHSLNIDFFFGNSKTIAPYKGYEDKPHTSYRTTLEYSLNCHLWGGKTFPGYFGGEFRLLIFLTQDKDADIRSRAPPTFIGLTSLDIYICQKWVINEKNTLVFSVGYPLLGYAIRSAYAGIDEIWGDLYNTPFKFFTLGRFTSFHNYWDVYGGLKYQYKFNSLLEAYTGLGFEYSHISFPREKKDAIFRLSGGVTFTFWGKEHEANKKNNKRH